MHGISFISRALHPLQERTLISGIAALSIPNKAPKRKVVQKPATARLNDYISLTGGPSGRILLEMAIHPIVVWPDPRLREETQTIKVFNESVQALYQDLADTMYAYNGLGIAAPQIGVAKKMFLVEPQLAGLSPEDPPVAFINCDVLSEGDEYEEADEGCLSFPGIYVPVERPYQTTVCAQNLKGEIFEMTGEGLLARCLLHENDHLTGRILVDFVGPLKKKMIKLKLKKHTDEIFAS